MDPCVVSPEKSTVSGTQLSDTGLGISAMVQAAQRTTITKAFLDGAGIVTAFRVYKHCSPSL